MLENISSKVSRIINGSLNSFVESLEQVAPDVMMEQAIREVDRAIDEVRTKLGRVISKQHLVHARLVEEDSRHKALSRKISIALEAERDDLTEVAIAKLLEIEAQKLVLESTIENCIQQTEELQAYILAMKVRRREMIEELSRLKLSPYAQTNQNDQHGLDIEGRFEKAETAFNRLLEKETGLPSSSDVPGQHKTVKLAELEELGRQNAIQERLAQLKAKKE